MNLMLAPLGSVKMEPLALITDPATSACALRDTLDVTVKKISSSVYLVPVPYRPLASIWSTISIAVARSISPEMIAARSFRPIMISSSAMKRDELVPLR